MRRTTTNEKVRFKKSMTDLTSESHRIDVDNCSAFQKVDHVCRRSLKFSIVSSKDHPALKKNPKFFFCFHFSSSISRMVREELLDRNNKQKRTTPLPLDFCFSSNFTRKKVRKQKRETNEPRRPVKWIPHCVRRTLPRQNNIVNKISSDTLPTVSVHSVD